MGVVYKIHCRITGEDYYGSTKNDMKVRLWGHKQMKGCSSKQIIERGDYEVVELEHVDDDQLLVRERHYITTYPCVNKKSPFRTEEEDKLYYQEWAKQHKDELKQYNQEYRQTHYDKLREQHRKYQRENKEKLKAQQSQLYTCQCGVKSWWGNKKRHERSKFHLDFIKNLSINNEQAVLGRLRDDWHETKEGSQSA